MKIAALLKEKVAVFKDLSADHVDKVVVDSQVRSYVPNEAIAYAGEEPRFFYAILSGSVAASILGDGGVRQTLGHLNAGDTFGEMGVLTGDPTPADFFAQDPSQVLEIPLPLFRATLMTQPTALQQISRTLMERTKAVSSDPAKAAVLRGAKDPYGLELKGERPERILVINCGSSSLKYSFYDTANESRAARGTVERIGLEGTRLAHSGPTGSIKKELATGGFQEAIAAMLRELTARDTGVLGSVGEVSIVAHRVVHGGERYTEATLITDEMLAELEKLSPLAPLHNPVNIAGIREMRKAFAAAPHVAVFDTAFHHTMPAYAYLYGLPYEFYERKGVRRYGFHGTSHAYVTLRAAEHLKRRPNELVIVSCHLGNGSSLCAVDHGRSIDTTMGFTPSEGLIMGTRCGDLDSGVLAFLERNEGLSAVQAEDILNKNSGLLGLSGISSDMREVLSAADEGNPRALLALKAYCYRVRKFIGAYVAAMGGLDAVVFTGGIGQGSAMVRALALQGLGCMGITLDDKANQAARGFEGVSRISSESSKISVLIVPTDEERMMAREALRAISRSYLTDVLSAQKQQPFLVEVSAHHIHLTQEHVEALFGPGHHLTRHADLSQPGQYACKEQLAIIGPKGKIERIRVLGPTRKYTQVEIAMTEQFRLGVHPPIRESGDIKDTPGCTLEGPAGQLKLDRGVICALRHVHMTPADALRYGVHDKSVVRVRIAGDRELVFGDVLVRVDPSFALAMHIDTDEANAANVHSGTQGYIDRIQD